MRPLHLQGINDGLGEIHGGGVAPHVRRAHLQGDGRLGTRRGPAESGVPLAPTWAVELGFGSLEPSVPPKWSQCFGAGGLLCPTPAPQGLVCAVAALPQPPKAVRGPQARQGSVGPFISKAGIQSTTRWHSPVPWGTGTVGSEPWNCPVPRGWGAQGAAPHAVPSLECCRVTSCLDCPCMGTLCQQLPRGWGCHPVYC